jgi:hypothetical protein
MQDHIVRSGPGRDAWPDTVRPRCPYKHPNPSRLERTVDRRNPFAPIRAPGGWFGPTPTGSRSTVDELTSDPPSCAHPYAHTLRLCAHPPLLRTLCCVQPPPRQEAATTRHDKKPRQHATTRCRDNTPRQHDATDNTTRHDETPWQDATTRPCPVGVARYTFPQAWSASTSTNTTLGRVMMGDYRWPTEHLYGEYPHAEFVNLG